MARYSKVYKKIWFSPTFCNLSDDAKMLFLYLLTCPWNNQIGLFVLKLGYALADLKWDEKRFRKAMKELQETVVWGGKKGLVKWDEKTGLLWIRNFLEHNPLYNPNQVKAAIKKLEELPKSPLMREFAERARELGNEKYEPMIVWIEEALKNVASIVNEEKKEREKETEKTGTTPLFGEDQSLEINVPGEKDVETQKSREAHEPRKETKRVPSCPYKEIIETFNVVLGNDLQPVDLSLPISYERRKLIKNLWRKLFLTRDKEGKHTLLAKLVELNGTPPTEKEAIFWFRRYFEYVRESDFLCGRVNRGAGDPWKANFNWLLNWKNVQKVLEGNYHDDKWKTGKAEKQAGVLAEMLDVEVKGKEVPTFADLAIEKAREILERHRNEQKCQSEHTYTDSKKEVSDSPDAFQSKNISLGG